MYINDYEVYNKLLEELDIVVQVDLNKDSKIRIISKDDIKEKLGRSPDYADAVMMRCYFDLIYLGIEEQEEIIINKSTRIYDNGYESLDEYLNRNSGIDETDDISII